MRLGFFVKSNCMHGNYSAQWKAAAVEMREELSLSKTATLPFQTLAQWFDIDLKQQQIGTTSEEFGQRARHLFQLGQVDVLVCQVNAQASEL